MNYSEILRTGDPCIQIQVLSTPGVVDVNCGHDQSVVNLFLRNGVEDTKAAAVALLTKAGIPEEAIHLHSMEEPHAELSAAGLTDPAELERVFFHYHQRIFGKNGIKGVRGVCLSNRGEGNLFGVSIYKGPNVEEVKGKVTAFLTERGFDVEKLIHFEEVPPEQKIENAINTKKDEQSDPNVVEAEASA